ncbi:MAG: autotransporter-associated beta strand repeat-containing protein, partial [Gemmataceae bacterium]|nr:autotransporter-associated beta strand repeat-containing protein [Gemmataceae bacterium]
GTTITAGGGLTVAVAAAGTIDGVIAGPGGLVKRGAGDLTLAGANTYAGPTTVAGGTLLVNGDQSAAAGPVAVNAGTLAGTGTLGGVVTVNAGGTINPGSPAGVVGTLTVGGLRFNGGTYRADFTVSRSDTIATAGPVDLAAPAVGAFVVGNEAGALGSGADLNLIRNTGPGPIAGTLAGAGEQAAGTANGVGGYFTYEGGNGRSFIFAPNGFFRYNFPAPGDYTLRLRGPNLRFVRDADGEILDARPLASVASFVEVNATAGDDTLTLDYRAPGGFFRRDIEFAGGDGFDTLRLLGGTFGRTRYDHAGPQDGAIWNYADPGGAVALNRITYTGLAPIVNTGTAADVVFNLPAGGTNEAVLEDAPDFPGPPGVGLTRLRSANGTFEQTDFANPTNSLTVTRSNPTDTLTVDAVPDFTAGLTAGRDPFGGNASFAAVTVLADLSLTTGSGDLTVFADAINLGGPPSRAATIRTANAQTYNGPVALAADVTLVSTGGGNVAFAGAVDGPGGLTVTTAGATTFAGPVGAGGALAALTSDGGGATTFAAGLVQTTGGQTYDDAVTVAADVTFRSTGGGAIRFRSTLDGGFDVRAETVGATAFDGVIGGTDRLRSLVTDAGGTTAVDGGSVRTTGGQTYGDPVTAGAAATEFDSDGNGAITFGATLGGASAVSVRTGGATTFGGAVTVGSLATDAGGTTAVDGGLVRTDGGQTYGDPVTVGAAATFASTGGGAVAFDATLDGGFAVAVNTGGVTTFGGAVGGATPLAALTTDAPGSTRVNGGRVRTAGGQGFGDPVAVGANTTFESVGPAADRGITFGGTLDGGFAVAVNTPGVTTFGGAVGGGTALAALTTDAPGSTAVGGGLVRTAGNQTYGDSVTVTTDTAFRAEAAGAVTFLGDLDGPFQITLSTDGAVQLGDAAADAVGRTAPPNTILFPGALGVVRVNAGLFRVQNQQTFPRPLTVGADAAAVVRVESVNNREVGFGSTVDGPGGLVVATAGLTTFLAPVGAGTPPASLATAVGPTDANGGPVITTGPQTYAGPVYVSVDSEFRSTGGGAITFAGSLDNLPAAGPFAVAVNTAGLTVFGGAVGGNGGTGLRTLTTDAGGTTAVNGGLVRTVEDQAFGDDVVALSGTFRTTGTGSVVFARSLTGAAAANPDLRVESALDVRFDGPVGAPAATPAAVGALTVTAGRDVIAAAGVVVAGPVGVTAQDVSVAGGLNASGALTATVQNLIVAGGTQVGGDATLTATRDVSVTGGLTAGGSLTATVRNLTLAGGAQVGGNATLTATREASVSGGLGVGGTLTAAVRNLILTEGVRVGGDADLAAAENISVAGDLDAGGAVLVRTAQDLVLSGSVTAAGFRQLAGTGTTGLAGGTLTTTRDGVGITTGSIVLGSGVVAAGQTVGLTASVGGVNQTFTAGGLIAGDLRLTGAGPFRLNNPANAVGGVFGADVTGPVTLRVAGGLTVDPAVGVTTGGQNLTIYAGGALTLIDPDRGPGRYSRNLIDVGGAAVVIVPGIGAAGPTTFTFDAELRAGSARFGNPAGSPADADGRPTNNAGRDRFRVRPSRNVVVTVVGNDPATFPGDSVFPFTTTSALGPGVSAGVATIRFVQEGADGASIRGRYEVTFAGGGAGVLRFEQVESFGELGYRAAAVQTAARDYSIRLQLVQTQPTQGAVRGQAIEANPFVVAPVFVNPLYPFSAPALAFGDVDGDGRTDLVIAAGADDAPLVTVIRGARLFEQDRIDLNNLDPDRDLIAQFYAFDDPTFRGGLSVAAADFDGDGAAEVVVGAGRTGGPRVSVYGLRPGAAGLSAFDRMTTAAARVPAALRNFLAFEGSQRGGVNVAAGDVDGDGTADLVVGAGAGGGPRVKVYSGKTGDPVQDFFAYEDTLRGGVLVAAGEYDPARTGAEILTGPGYGGAPRVRVFGYDPAGPVGLADFFAPGFMTPPRGLTVLNPTATAGVGGVAFGAPAADGRQDILVGSARGPGLQLRQYAFDAAGRITAEVDLFAALAQEGQPNAVPIPDPATGAALGRGQLFDGATVAGFSVPGDDPLAVTLP